MNLLEMFIATLVICFCTAFGFVWGVIMSTAKREDERNDQQRMAAKHGDD